MTSWEHKRKQLTKNGQVGAEINPWQQLSSGPEDAQVPATGIVGERQRQHRRLPISRLRDVRCSILRDDIQGQWAAERVQGAVQRRRGEDDESDVRVLPGGRGNGDA